MRCILEDSGLPTFVWGELVFTAAFHGNRVPRTEIGMQSPYKVLHGTDPDLRSRGVVGAQAFAHIDPYSKPLELKAVESGGVQQQKQVLQGVQFGHPAHYVEQERHLHRGTIAHIPAIVGINFAADCSA